MYWNSIGDLSDCWLFTARTPYCLRVRYNGNGKFDKGLWMLGNINIWRFISPTKIPHMCTSVKHALQLFPVYGKHMWHMIHVCNHAFHVQFHAYSNACVAHATFETHAVLWHVCHVCHECFTCVARNMHVAHVIHL